MVSSRHPGLLPIPCLRRAHRAGLPLFRGILLLYEYVRDSYRTTVVGPSWGSALPVSDEDTSHGFHTRLQDAMNQRTAGVILCARFVQGLCKVSETPCKAYNNKFLLYDGQYLAHTYMVP
jgi:hypothetical protein